jgi:tRNA(fMet)-specific endonuclease VapC
LAVRSSEGLGSKIASHAYDKLLQATISLAAWKLLPWNHGSAQRFIDLRKEKVRIGTADLKIACIALEHSSTLLTRNARDFGLVPGLTIADWLS